MFMTAGVYAFNYNSVWINTDANTRGITKIVIKNTGQIKAFGQCHPRDCDWGNTGYTRTRNGLLASWRQAGIGHKVIYLEAINSNKIKVVVKYLYRDNRRDKTKIMYFKKRHNNTNMHARTFTGDWVSENVNTRSLTRMNVYRSGNHLSVKAWGKCHPTDCSWGSARATRSNNKLTVRWNRGFVDRVMTIKGENFRHGKFQTLRIKTVSHFHDSRGTQTKVEYMQRRR